MPERIAEVCHEANRALQIASGEPCPSLPWALESKEVHRFAAAAVEFARQGGTPEEQFRDWSRAKVTDGWTYGPVKDPVAKTHPCLVADYTDLPAEQRAKDAVFAAIVRAMSGDARPAPERPRIVCLCGSTRYYDEFRRANLRLTLAGQIVLSIGCDTRSDGDLAVVGELGTDPVEVKARLDDLHKRKIDLASYVLVVSDEAGYFGQSTAGEIAYAVKHGKPVLFAHEAAAEHAKAAGLLPPEADEDGQPSRAYTGERM